MENIVTGTPESRLEEKTLEILVKLFPGTRVLCQDKSMPGTPDFSLDFNDYKMAVFVDGDFFHGQKKMERLGLKMTALGETEKAFFWLNKSEKNKRRDKSANAALRKLGIPSVRILERGLRGKDPEGYVSRTMAYALLNFFKKNMNKK